MPSSAIGIPRSRAPVARKASITPRKVGASQSTVSPGSSSTRAVRSAPCWAPVTMRHPSPFAGVNFPARKSSTAVRSPGSPWGTL